MHKTLFIINPKAGTARKDMVENAIQEHIDRTRHEASIEYTTHAGHAAEIAREHAGKVDIIVAVGGDGTVNEVVVLLVNRLDLRDLLRITSARGGADLIYGYGLLTIHYRCESG